MGTKLNPGQFDCFHRAKPDEPMMVLLARDELAPGLTELWAQKREDQIERGERPDTPNERLQIMEARQCAQSMRMWALMNKPLTEQDG